MSTIEDALSPAEKAVLDKLVAKVGGAEIEPNADSIIDARPASYQLTEEVEEIDDGSVNELVLYIGGIEKARTLVIKPDLTLKEFHPERFVEQVDKAKAQTTEARRIRAMWEQRIETANQVSSPEALHKMVLGDDSEEPIEPAKALEDITEKHFCDHPGCGKSFPTVQGLRAHKRAAAHAECAEGGELWETSFAYARLQKAEKEAASDKKADTEGNKGDKESSVS